MSLNSIVIQGRLVRDPELRSTQSGVSVATFTVAVDKDFARDGAPDKTDFINVVAWRQAGEFVSKYFRKGSSIIVSGRLQSRKWEDRDGKKRVEWEVNAENVYFCGDKKQDDESVKTPNISAEDFIELDESSGELPF